MRKKAINNKIKPPSAAKIMAFSTGLPSAFISGIDKTLAIIMAAMETGPTDNVLLLPKNA